MTTEDRSARLAALSAQEHAECIICGAGNQQGLRLKFETCPDGSVTTVFPCRKTYQGFQGIIHGGIISCLLDGAMTNCLFSHGIAATTGELTMRYLHPVRVGYPAVVKARLRRSRARLHILEAELSQNGEVVVRATGKFMERR